MEAIELTAEFIGTFSIGFVGIMGTNAAEAAEDDNSYLLLLGAIVVIVTTVFYSWSGSTTGNKYQHGNSTLHPRAVGVAPGNTPTRGWCQGRDISNTRRPSKHHRRSCW